MYENQTTSHSATRLATESPTTNSENGYGEYKTSPNITKKGKSDPNKFLRDYTTEEKLEWAHQKKLKASRLFGKKRFDEAIQYYKEAVTAMDYANESDISQQLKERFVNDIKIPIFLNLAACLNEKRDYSSALAFCEEAIKLNPSHCKAYYRRGICYHHLENDAKALEDLKKSLELCQDESQIKSIKSVYEQIKNAKNSHKDKDDVADNLDEMNNTNNNSSDNVRVLKYNDDLEELNHLGPFKYVAYPVKMSARYIWNRVGCCRRRKDSYVSES